MFDDERILLNFQILGEDDYDSIEIPLSSTVQDIKTEICTAWDDIFEDDIDIYMLAVGESLHINQETIQMISAAYHPPQPFLQKTQLPPNYRPFKNSPPNGELHFIVHGTYSLDYRVVVSDLPIISTININPSRTTRDLKEKILQNHPTLRDLSKYLQFFRISVPLKEVRALRGNVGPHLAETGDLSLSTLLLDVFEKPPPKEHLHILVYYEMLTFWVSGEDLNPVHSIAFSPCETGKTLLKRIWDQVAKDSFPNATMSRIQLHKISVAHTSNLKVLANAIVPDDVPGQETLDLSRVLGDYYHELPLPSRHIHMMVIGPLSQDPTPAGSEGCEELFRREDIEEILDDMDLDYDGALWGHPHVARAISRVDDHSYFIKYHPQSNLNEVNILKILSGEVSSHNPIPQDVVFHHLSDGVLMVSLDGGPKVHQHEHLSRDLPIIVRDLIHGVAFLHAKKVVHNDLNPSNIVVDETTRRVSIIDYDLANINTDERMFVKGFIGTRGCAAPEVGGEKAYNLVKAEVWAVGNIVRHLCEACPDSEHREPLLQLSMRLMDGHPKKRPSMKEVVEMVDTYIASLNRVTHDSNGNVGLHDVSVKVF